MNPTTLALVLLRGVALALSLNGQTRASNSLYTLADASERGVNIDAHMAAVAEKLKVRSATEADWEDVVARIEADSDRLQAS
jgi:hypothetical protein